MATGGTAAQKAAAREFLTDTYSGDAAKAIERTIINPWGSDSWTMGAYSAARVGKVGARETLAQPVDNRPFFAGEAITTVAHSSLQGASLTGQAVAKSAIQHLGGS